MVNMQTVKGKALKCAWGRHQARQSPMNLAMLSMMQTPPLLQPQNPMLLGHQQQLQVLHWIQSMPIWHWDIQSYLPWFVPKFSSARLPCKGKTVCCWSEKNDHRLSGIFWLEQGFMKLLKAWGLCFSVSVRNLFDLLNFVISKDLSTRTKRYHPIYIEGHYSWSAEDWVPKE